MAAIIPIRRGRSTALPSPAPRPPHFRRGATPAPGVPRAGATFFPRISRLQNITHHNPIVPHVVPAAARGVSRKRISRGARQVLSRLNEEGFEAYLVGGCVRDLLLGREPKDFDVATVAHPEEVRQVFPRARIIGRRFRLAHVRSGREIIEVATFRANHDEEDAGPEGRVLHDNVYGTLEEDAVRRDFTINALYYDDRDQTVLDFTGGLDDLAAGRVHIIGRARDRYRQDPVRMLRAVRFAAKLDFRLDPATEAPIGELAPLIEEVPPARLFDEGQKLLQSGHGLASFQWLEHYGLMARLWPATAASLKRDPGQRALLEHALRNTDQRIAEDRPVTAGFLLAALFWGPVRERAARLMAGKKKYSKAEALHEAGETVFAEQGKHTSGPRRFTAMARDIWAMQPRLENPRVRRVGELIASSRFRAAYDFLCLRAAAGEPVAEHVKRWTEAQRHHPPAPPRGRGEEEDGFDGRRGPRPGGNGRRRRRGGRGGRGGGGARGERTA